MKRFQRPTMKGPPKITFFKNTYSPKTKVEFWYIDELSENKDNYVYRDGLSNMISTYNRLGNQDVGCSEGSETHAMLEQIWSKTDPVYTFKPLVNFTSYPCTDTPERNKLMKSAPLAQLPPDYGIMDYMTTQQDDFRNPFPSVSKPLTMKNYPWLLNRVIKSDCTQNYGNVPPKGNYQYFDTHTPLAHIRRLRQKRYQSYDPATGNETFPNVQIPDDPDYLQELDRKY